MHHSAWPKATDLGSAAAASGAMIDAVAAALTGIRGAKSQAKASMRAELSRGRAHRHARRCWPRCGWPRATCARPARSPATWCFTPDESAQQISVAAVVADTE